jgi:hypothetical protein
MPCDCGNFCGVQAGSTDHDDDGSEPGAVGITP